MLPRTHAAVWLVSVLAAFTLACSEPETAPSTFLDAKQPVERRVNDLIRRMRADEKLSLIRGEANGRLGIPARTTVTGAMGISARDSAGRQIVATAFPANIGMAATWNTALAEQEGGVIAQQARGLGRGQILGPLAEISHRELSGGVFETYGEDPWLASRMAAAFIGGVQGEGEIATAIYPDADAENQTARETDLRPLEAAVTEAGVWAVMPRAGGRPAGFLRSDLGFRGFTLPPGSEDVPDEEEVRGILRAMIASGVFDREPRVSRERETPAQRLAARAAAAQSIVLLKNEGGLLPLDRNRFRRIAVLGPNAAVNRMGGGNYTVLARYSDAPLDALRAAFGSGVFLARSPADAASADAAIVFVGTGAATEAEGRDRATADLPAGQDELIESVARANRHTIVVVIAGSSVAMDRWIDGVPAVLDAWFPGEEGGHAIADVLTGVVNPSGHLPVAFSALFPFGFGLSYTQFEYKDLVVLPAETPPGQFVEVSVTVRNAGAREGRETVQLYLRAPGEAGQAAGQRLRGFQQVELTPGEEKRVDFTLTEDALSRFDEKQQEWVQDSGDYAVGVGSSSRDMRVSGTFAVTE